MVVVGVAAVAFLLALNGGFYHLADRDALAVLVWWALGLMVVLGLWPVARVPPVAAVAAAALAAFAAFAALSALWAPAAETALTEANRVLLYLGIFILVVLAARPRDASRAIDGLALGIAAVGVLALASRLFPGLTGTQEVARLLPDSADRLSYPVDYWNGLGILVALGVPLLLRTATSIEAGRARGLALAALPVISTVVYLTSSRGAALAAAVAVLAYLALTDRRLLTMWAAAVGAGGSVLAVLVVYHRRALVNGPLSSDLAHSQGRSAALLIALICAGTAAVYLLGALRAPVRPRLAAPLRIAAAAAVVLGIVAAMIALDPAKRLDRFKVPPDEYYRTDTTKPGRYIESHLFSSGGSGRWQFWGSAEKEFSRHPVGGGGAGSFESWWAANGSITFYVRDAHSLWLETLGELGLVGLMLLVGFWAAVLVAGALVLRRAPPGGRNGPAALIAVVLAFCAGAALDWMWEMTVVAAIAVIAAGLLAALAARDVERPLGRPRVKAPIRLAAGAASLVLIAVIALPLLADLRMRASASASARGDTAAAIDAARDARRVAPWTSAPPTQLALLAERGRDLPAAREWIDRALKANDSDWRIWVTAARIETEMGDARAAEQSLARARKLNPRSPLFAAR